MEVSIGSTYKSPFVGRYIQILDIEFESRDSDYSVLSVLMIDKDTLESEPQSIRVSREDLSHWVEVKL